jgi:hypothetical protein
MMSLTYFECVSVALVIQYLKLMRRIMLLSVAFPTLQRVFHISPQRENFRKEVTDHQMCVLIFSTFF